MQSEGQAAIITGAGSGMGQATAVRLAQAGFSIAGFDRDPNGLAATQAMIAPSGAKSLMQLLDVSHRDEVEEGVRLVRNQLGPIRAVAAAAAIWEGARALDASVEHYERILRTNIFGVIWVNVAAARFMMNEGYGGRIVNWASVGAIGGAVGFSGYALSKAAVCSFTQSLALEVAHAGITVNAILPGSIQTPMTSGVNESTVAARTPLRRWGQPEDVAAVATFLLTSEEASWITGALWNIDGGELASRVDLSVQQT